jgi:hypothetical protein
LLLMFSLSEQWCCRLITHFLQYIRLLYLLILNLEEIFIISFLFIEQRCNDGVSTEDADELFLELFLLHLLLELLLLS